MSDVDIEFPDGQVYKFHFAHTENKEVEKQRICKSIFKTCLVETFKKKSRELRAQIKKQIRENLKIAVMK